MMEFKSAEEREIFIS